MADSVWAVPLSLAATDGISIDFSSSSYSDASLRTRRQGKRAEEGDDDLVNQQRRTTHKRRQQSARPALRPRGLVAELSA